MGTEAEGTHMGDLIKDATTGRFVMGHPKTAGAGRPDGSRDRLCRDFIADLGRDWEKHGHVVIARVRERNPLAYFKLVARVVRSQRVEQIASTPHDADLNPVHQAAAMLTELRQRCGERGIDALKLLITLDKADDERDDVAASAGGPR
jgi:hypothetical protein